MGLFIPSIFLQDLDEEVDKHQVLLVVDHIIVDTSIMWRVLGICALDGGTTRM